MYKRQAVERVADAEAGRGRVRGPKLTRTEIDQAVNAAYEADARFHQDIQTVSYTHLGMRPSVFRRPFLFHGGFHGCPIWGTLLSSSP